MAGETERCMYCEDSHGTDIEHFRPKTPFPECLFVWPNLLLCCAECGRFKGDRFPTDAAGVPLLIDPTTEDPWEHLEFDPDTGNIVARFHPDRDAFSAKGEQTVEHLHLDRREALSRVYRRSYLRISEIVKEAVDSFKPEATALIERLRERDDNGILAWCFHGSGQQIEPFSNLKRNYREVWLRCWESFR